jgi:hypothetical protein
VRIAVDIIAQDGYKQHVPGRLLPSRPATE